jgi:hypothetical protein
MFFDEIKLSRKSWHYKLMKFTWGRNTPNLWSFCPYFWLTIFNFLILPFTLCVRVVQGFFNFLDRKLFVEPYERFLQENSENPLFAGRLFEHDLESKDLPRKSMFSRKKYYSMMEELNDILAKKWGFEKDPNYMWSEDFQKRKRSLVEKYWEEVAKRREAKNELSQKKLEILEARRIERQRKAEKIDRVFSKIFSPFTYVGKKISSALSRISNFFSKPDVYKIIKITKQTVSFIVVSTVILTASYCLFIFGKYLYFKVDISWSWKFFFYGCLFGLKLLGLVWATGTVIFYLWYILKKPIGYLNNWLQDIELPRTRGFFLSLGKIVSAPIIFLIIKPLGFFVLYFKAVKNENCPAIIWEEEK